ncbi:MAG TPA: diguanylate cyclase [Candidatus Omnitrophota bacterium]|nr:diguanylate cyclase [Candidatus Omnitrophota bacterium]HPS36539.1 diguanylate cyclase [Candidatus Omnitrophota bacterium]
MDQKKFLQPGLRLLLVEDDPEFAGILKIRLSKETNPPLLVTWVPDLAQALLALREPVWDLILLDLMLPDSSGIQTFITVRAQANHAPIVIMTGLDNDNLAIDAVRKGAEDFLVKGDTNSKLLLRIIHHAIDRHSIKEKLASVTGRLRETNLRLEKMAILDPLTELYNRRGLQHLLKREMQVMSREGGQLLVLLIDLDDFKYINDTLGHPVGDLLLKETGKRIKESVRLSDHVARVGGDEFILLLPKTDLREGIQLAERIRLAVSNTTITLSEKAKVRVTASLGLTPVTEEVTSIDELLIMADPFLRRSKNEGKNRVSYEVLHESEQHPRATVPHHLTSLMRQGNDFFALKQPIIRLTDNSVIGYEFLSRLKRDNVYTPDEFFRIAMENNMLTLVDHHCFRSCISASVALPPEMHRHINLFPTTIIDLPVEELVEKLAATCPAHSYCFEISEQQLLGEPSYLIGPVQTFKRYGISVAVDDVGFGNTCFESLILLEPDVIKLDKKYVKGIAQNPHVERSFRRILKVAEDLNAEVIAEGIETEEDLQRLKELGVKYGQGFYLGMPA